MTTKAASYVPIKTRIDVSVRKRWVQESKEQFSSKLPLIIEPNLQELDSQAIPGLHNPKFLFPAEFSCAQVLTVLRKKLDLQQTESLLLFVEGRGRYRLLRPQQRLQDVFSAYVSKEDGMLYLVYAKENIFG